MPIISNEPSSDSIAPVSRGERKADCKEGGEHEWVEGEPVKMTGSKVFVCTKCQCWVVDDPRKPESAASVGSGLLAKLDYALEGEVVYNYDLLKECRRILDGLPQDAIDGGWTAAGIRAYAKSLEDRLAAPAVDYRKALEELRAKYDELLYQVVNKVPGETRHQSALRCIRAWESQSRGPALAAQAPKDATPGEGK